MDVVQEIARFNPGRDPERLQLKYQRMRSDTFVFLRGTSHLVYQLSCPRQGPGIRCRRMQEAGSSAPDLNLQSDKHGRSLRQRTFFNALERKSIKARTLGDTY
jgi:hypothetical protein